jgi:hypothetical protein
MGLDIKIPIGMLFSILGLLLTLFGAATGGDAMYHKSLGININLWTGLFMLAFGLFMLLLAWLDRKKEKSGTE